MGIEIERGTQLRLAVQAASRAFETPRMTGQRQGSARDSRRRLPPNGADQLETREEKRTNEALEIVVVIASSSEKLQPPTRAALTAECGKGARLVKSQPQPSVRLAAPG